MVELAFGIHEVYTYLWPVYTELPPLVFVYRYFSSCPQEHSNLQTQEQIANVECGAINQ